MPVTITIGSEREEQAWGDDTNSGRMNIYAVQRGQPLNLIFLGGHRIDDAFTYTTNERVVSPQYIIENGRHIVRNKTLEEQYTTSIEFNLNLPNKFMSVVDRLAQQQNSCTFDLLFFPDSCSDGCDEVFFVGRDAKFGTKQFNSAFVGYGENEGPITSFRQVSITGDLLQYNGMEVLEIFENAIYDWNGIEVVEDQCLDCECPYQRLVVVGSDTDAAPNVPVVALTTDGGANWSVQSTGAGEAFAGLSTAIGDTLFVGTDAKFYNGRLFVTAATAYQAASTTGGIVYSLDFGNNWSEALNANTGAVLNVPFHQIIRAFGALYAAGDDGWLWRSCDNGVQWSQFARPAPTGDFIWYAMDYDTENNILWLGGNNGTDPIVYYFDGSNFVNVTSDINMTATFDVHDIRVAAPGHVIVTLSDGSVYESYNYRIGKTNTWSIFNLGVDVDAAVFDGLSYRSIFAYGTDLAIRDVYGEQNINTEFFKSFDGNVRDMVSTVPLLGEGENAFFGVTDAGEVFRVAQCYLCLESCE